MRHILTSIAASVLLAMAASPAWSAYCSAVSAGSSLSTCTGIDNTPNGTVPAAGNAAKAKGEFLDGKSSVGALNFNQYAPFSEPSSAKGQFAGQGGSVNMAEFSPSQLAGPFVVSDTGVGRFNTTGDAGGLFLESAAGFTMVFDNALSAFGFFATDVGDFDGPLTINLFLKEDSEGPAATLSVVRESSGLPGGSLLFFGFYNTDTTVKYKKIEFVQNNPDDGFGYDDMVVASIAPPNPTPEPAGLALVGAALGAAGLARRRQQRRAN